MQLNKPASLGSMGQVQQIGVETADIGRIGQLASTIEQVSRLARNQHDWPGRAEVHHLIRRQQQTALQMLPDTTRRADRLAPLKIGQVEYQHAMMSGPTRSNL